jgi:hypothetical protein
MARYMIIVKGSYDDEVNPPSGPEFDQMLVDMGKYNQMLLEAGVMLAGEGLTQSKDGAKVQFGKGKPPTVKDGPFTEAKELVGGFWIIKAENLDEALGWAKQIPFDSGEVEVRRVSETEDFEFNDTTRETLEREQAQRASGVWKRDWSEKK